MNNEEKILALLEQMNGRLDGMEQGQAATNIRLDSMQSDLEQIKEDVEQIKEDARVTRETVNMLGEWTEIASDVLKIQYPVHV